MADLAALLPASREGDAEAFAEAYSLAYDELRRLAQIVEWRFFGGMTEDEVGDALGITARTVRRDWQKAKAFLYRELTRPS
jgi:DNA-directed RNA polymerase specialized sigma24 family protein